MEQQYQVAQTAIDLKAKSERIFLHYALALSILLVIAGSALIILGIGDHLDILVQRGDLEARFINASPGVVLWLIGAFVFWASKPRRLKATAQHGAAPDISADQRSNVTVLVATELDRLLPFARKRIDKAIEDGEEQLHQCTEALRILIEDEAQRYRRQIKSTFADYSEAAGVTGAEGALPQFGESPVNGRLIRVRRRGTRFEITDSETTALLPEGTILSEVTRKIALQQLAEVASAGSVGVLYQGTPPHKAYREAAEREE